MPSVLDLFHRCVTLPLIRLLLGVGADTADRAGAALGVLVFYFGLRRTVVSANIALTLGLRGATRRDIARRSYATMGANFLSLWTFGGVHGPQCGVRFLNPLWMTHLHRVCPGRVMLSPHLGAWEVGGMAVAQSIGGMLVYAKRQHDELLDREIQRARTSVGIEILLAHEGGKGAAITAMRALRSGRTLALTADQSPSGKDGIAAWFLGVATMCHDGPAVFSRRARVPIVPSFCLRSAAGHYVVFTGRPMPAHSDDNAMIQAGMDYISAMVAAFPGQYFWHHRRFKRPIELARRREEPWRTRGLRLLVARNTDGT